MPVEIKTIPEGSLTIPQQELDDELRTSFRGPIFTPEDPGYEEARTVENLHIDRRPGLIVRPSGVADVIDAVDMARERNLLVAIRGGGHHVAGHGTSEGGMVIDLSDMDGVWVDEPTRSVRVQGGATWGDVDRDTQIFGLAVPGGIVSTTGVGGLTLGGGIGWLHRKWGLACDSLTAARVITSDGRLVRASEKENPDLFWALRGGGGNFGVVVDFEFDAKPLGPTVFAAAVFYAADQGRELLHGWRDWASGVPDEVTTRALFWTMPDEAPGLPPEVLGREVLIMSALYAGNAEAGAEALDPVRHLGEPLADISGPMPYRFFQSAFDPLLAGLSSYWKSTFLRELGDEAIDFVSELAMNRPDPKCLVHVPLMGGATSRVGAEDTAFGDRSAPWMLSVDGNWTDPKNGPGVIAWVREAVESARALPGGGGAYLNFSAEARTDAGDMSRQFGDNLDRLRKVKRTYDPDNLFRINNNILP